MKPNESWHNSSTKGTSLKTTQLRFSDLSDLRQAFVRECQIVAFGKISRLIVQDADPVFGPQTEVYIDLKLDTDQQQRSEQNVTDFVLSAEIIRLFFQLDDIRDGIIEHVEIRSGLPRRIVFKRAF